MNNLHISLTPFKNETRVLKQTKSISKLGFFSEVYIASLHEEQLKMNEKINECIFLRRFSLVTRFLPKNLFFQAFKYLEFCLRVIFYYKNKNIKMVNVHSVALLPLGVLIKYIYRAKLIYDTHELETETNGLQGIRKKLIKLLEKNTIGFADFTFVVSENIADWYRDQYSMPRPPVIFNAPLSVEILANNKFRDELGIKPEQTIFLYQGGLLKGRGIELIVEAFEELINTNAVIIFMGFGELSELVKNKSTSCKNIFFYPAVAPDIVLEYTSSADIGIALIENTCLNHFYCMPNKLFEYAMAGLPVLVSNIKEMREFVEKYEMGSALQEYSATELVHTIIELLNQDVSAMKKNATRAAAENCWAVQETKMIKAYKELWQKV